MYPLQLGHLLHASDELVGGSMQRVEVIAIKTVFQLGHLKIVEALELHIRLWEMLAPQRLVVGQQFERCLL